VTLVQFVIRHDKHIVEILNRHFGDGAFNHQEVNLVVERMSMDGFFVR
jgi:hypothetical protein